MCNKNDEQKNGQPNLQGPPFTILSIKPITNKSIKI
jgi:hypothetical protein